MSFGFGNQAVIANSPFLVSADTHPFDRGARTRACTSEGPVINDAVAVYRHFVHSYDQIRKRAHEALGGGSDRRPAY